MIPYNTEKNFINLSQIHSLTIHPYTNTIILITYKNGEQKKLSTKNPEEAVSTAYKIFSQILKRRY